MCDVRTTAREVSGPSGEAQGISGMEGEAGECLTAEAAANSGWSPICVPWEITSIVFKKRGQRDSPRVGPRSADAEAGLCTRPPLQQSFLTTAWGGSGSAEGERDCPLW